MMFIFRLPLFALMGIATLLPRTARAESQPAPEKIQASVQRGVDFLKTTQSEDGSWSTKSSLGITALVTHALLVSDISREDATVQSGLKIIEQNVQSDGGIYHEKSTHKNYETAISLLALTSANQDGKYQEQIDNAVKFLKHLQWDEDEVESQENVAFGGAGYGSHSRPDLSNTTFFLDALRASGVAASDPAVQKALVFVSRCQNLESPENTTPFAAKLNDGGFYYTPAAGGSSQAGTTPDGGLRSYASMTYAGLKSMIYAGLTEEDPRVKAAEDWIQKFYSLDENPGMGQQGLFYYYQTFAKTLDVLGKSNITDASGVAHDWRSDLATQLLSKQQANGSWVNSAERWYEGDPNLVTAYALMSLSHCQPEKGE